MSAERCADMIQVPPQTVTLFFFEQREAMLLSTATSSKASYSFALLRPKLPTALVVRKRLASAIALWRKQLLTEVSSARLSAAMAARGACFTSFVLCAAFTVVCDWNATLTTQALCKWGHSEWAKPVFKILLDLWIEIVYVKEVEISPKRYCGFL